MTNQTTGSAPPSRFAKVGLGVGMGLAILLILGFAAGVLNLGSPRAGDADGPAGAPAPSARPDGAVPSPAPTPGASSGVPADLIGVWSSADDTVLIVRPDGTFSLQSRGAEPIEGVVQSDSAGNLLVVPSSGATVVVTVEEGLGDTLYLSVDGEIVAFDRVR